MFEDCRSKKIILVAHCILNQNAKLDKCAHCPGAVKDVVQILLENNVGIVQMPCPELLYLGLDRETDPNLQNSVEFEDSRIYLRMLEPKSIEILQQIVRDIVHQIKEYDKNGFEIIGLLGINGSPTCGIESTWYDNENQDGYGIFIELLAKECQYNSINISMKGIRSKYLSAAIQTVSSLFD